jgi:hypothetical protein
VFVIVVLRRSSDASFENEKHPSDVFPQLERRARTARPVLRPTAGARAALAFVLERVQLVDDDGRRADEVIGAVADERGAVERWRAPAGVRVAAFQLRYARQVDLAQLARGAQ